MPLYEYYCTDCETKFEALRPMSKADDPIQCQNCEGMRTSRALSRFAAHIKGGTSAATEHSHSTKSGCGGCGGGNCGHCH
jgi:putative FmdB family regulatory protein